MNKTAAKWMMLPPLRGGSNPCLNCPPIVDLLSMKARIAVGFGYAALTCDGLEMWSERGADWEDCMTVLQAEKRAAEDPDHDWRIVKHGPLHGETYQRQGKRRWVLVERNQGFA